MCEFLTGRDNSQLNLTIASDYTLIASLWLTGECDEYTITTPRTVTRLSNGILCFQTFCY